MSHRKRNTHIKLARDEQGCCPNQLQPIAFDMLVAEEMVDQLDGQIERLVVQLKVLLNLNKPVDQNGTHMGRQVGLDIHEVREDELCLEMTGHNI